MKKTKLILGFIIVFVFGSLILMNSQKTLSQINIVRIEKMVNDGREIEISSNFTLSQYDGESLEEFVTSQPLPQMKISFRKENIEDLNLTIETIDDLKKHWTKLLKHSYLTKVLDFSNEINYQKEDIILSQSVFDTNMHLTEQLISSEYELGTYSSKEAYKIIAVLRESAKQVVDEANKIKQIKASK